MKLIVTGATGFVGTEVIRLALRNPAVKTVIALARKPVSAPENAGSIADASKLRSVILEDWASPYPDSVKEQLQGADACIWTLAVTPTKSKAYEFAEVTKICHDYTVNAIENMAAIANKPFRFIYTSGFAAERDQTQRLGLMGEYRLMRGRAENAVIEFAKKHDPDVQATVCKPGTIDGPGRAAIVRAALAAIFDMFGIVPKVHVSELAAAMIDQCLNGITKDPLMSDDMVQIGQRVLSKEDYAGAEAA